jgi:hypothetical protein
MIVFIDTLYTALEQTYNYSAVTGLHILQFTVTHTVGFLVFSGPMLATDL